MVLIRVPALKQNPVVGIEYQNGKRAMEKSLLVRLEFLRFSYDPILQIDQGDGLQVDVAVRRDK